MTLYTDIFNDSATLIGRVWFDTPNNPGGVYNQAVPAGAHYCRAVGCGSGGQGDHWGGSAAWARAGFVVTPAENLKIQVGDIETSTTQGDSYVWRNDGTTILLHADRGRGTNPAGLASNSNGDALRDGAPGVDGTATGGAPASDLSDYASLGFGGVGNHYTNEANGAPSADWGGGGHNVPVTDSGGVLVGFAPFLAGTGRVVLEFYDIDPGF